LVGTLEQVFREEWGRVLATLVGFLGDFDLAEEAAQEAFAVAADRWPREGVPSNPRAWLMRTARNRATDHIRRDRGVQRQAEEDRARRLRLHPALVHTAGDGRVPLLDGHPPRPPAAPVGRGHGHNRVGQAGVENFEERLAPGRIDPLVLGNLRNAAAA